MFFNLCRISVLLLLYPPLPPDLYFSMQLAQPVNTIRNEFTHERCAGRSSLQSRNFSSMGHSQYVKSPPALFSNCLQQMFMEDEVCLLQTVFFLWRFRSSFRWTKAVLWQMHVFTLLKIYLHLFIYCSPLGTFFFFFLDIFFFFF